MNEAKLEALIEHISSGGSLEQEDLADALSLSARSTKSIENYLAEASERMNNTFEIGGENPIAPSDEDEEEEDDEEEEEDQEDEEEEEDEEPEPEPAPKPNVQKKPYRFFLEQPDGSAVELEQVKKGGNVITFSQIQPTDIVQVMVKGEIVEVDLIPLRKLPPSDRSEYGVSNETLLILALAAKP
jgi:hypothetical protein